jgi:hypothetical protein
MPRPSFEREAIEAEIDRVRSLGVDALRTLWRTTFRSSPSPAFSKDVLARFLCWHIQEQAFGGLDPKTAKHLDGLARGDRSPADRSRCLKPGTVLLREYQGERHTVTVVANGRVWGLATGTAIASAPFVRADQDGNAQYPAFHLRQRAFGRRKVGLQESGEAAETPEQLLKWLSSGIHWRRHYKRRHNPCIQ